MSKSSSNMSKLSVYSVCATSSKRFLLRGLIFSVVEVEVDVVDVVLGVVAAFDVADLGVVAVAEVVVVFVIVDAVAVVVDVGVVEARGDFLVIVPSGLTSGVLGSGYTTEVFGALGDASSSERLGVDVVLRGECGPEDDAVERVDECSLTANLGDGKDLRSVRVHFGNGILSKSSVGTPAFDF